MKFSEYAKNKSSSEQKGDSIKQNQTAFEFLKSVASKYEGASENELILAIMSEAKRAKEEGRLTQSEIVNFVSTISPMLNEGQKARLQQIISQINND